MGVREVNSNSGGDGFCFFFNIFFRTFFIVSLAGRHRRGLAGIYSRPQIPVDYFIIITHAYVLLFFIFFFPVGIAIFKFKKYELRARCSGGRHNQFAAGRSRAA